MTTDGYNNSQRKQKVLERSVDVQQEREKEGEVCASNLISSQARSAKGLKKNCLPNNSDGESSQVHQNSETQDVFGFSGTPDCVAFNWTWGYRHDADIRTTYFYLEHSKQLPNISFLKDLVQKKEKPAAWFVSNCHEDQAQRLRYVERLKEVLPVDVYGACGTLHCTTLAKECDTMLTKYFFYLSFENSFCQDYVTEKFSRAFLKDVYVVPVVRGGLNYSHHFPQGIFINADDFSSPEELGMYLKKADERRRRLH
ncbi:alpha-(1,3)-fucosyltransferase C-like isoform X4 [Pomacea canaliculata]|uniref:alpha-(1,3)-fucosyltransferase C-like isoform X4 n=1 Tax=Pomacea canaliculata TaxID=400727 RepID=UPI000D72D451|nr:alpha-(1,3)-fucosyltransferase C-like isoform X4 [Pomacea canaliculata]